MTPLVFVFSRYPLFLHYGDYALCASGSNKKKGRLLLSWSNKSVMKKLPDETPVFLAKYNHKLNVYTSIRKHDDIKTIGDIKKRMKENHFLKHKNYMTTKFEHNGTTKLIIHTQTDIEDTLVRELFSSGEPEIALSVDGKQITIQKKQKDEVK